ncbi:3-oxo-5-alpha-steroid 4-dehydrogenase-domain-containing protein [Thamnidium elegans]|uniref:3-oxo-5-alpha-steroid 4-dehydrogenase C-terminal domain-containing protein n=1 Tax=Thamnidium elegans TaxID=101142 RepID=A0A8H7VXA1_9FUNG|nr:hypothetical protein INT48_000687 [Thamnidium elegans]KAI8090342.1 3-oxo-5-alpha-steroid 4-dehydrogenase-domain-containing protein [Thamnidium elegans]
MGYMTSIGLYVPTWSGLTISAFVFGSIITTLAVATLVNGTTPYSKFGNRPSVDNIPSKKAMLMIYSPCVIACLVIQRPALSTQFDIAHLFALIHFSKRVFEVLFVHIYKSKTDLETAISISFTYTVTTVLDLLVVRRIPEDVFSSTLTKYGIALFIAGEIINIYHHLLLRNMRSTRRSSVKGYSLPKGGLFNYTLVPHYFSEQITFLGLILVSQNIVSVTLRLFPFIYLSTRAAATRAWYSTHLTDKRDKAELLKRKNLIPFVW